MVQGSEAGFIQWLRERISVGDRALDFRLVLRLAETTAGAAVVRELASARTVTVVSSGDRYTASLDELLADYKARGLDARAAYNELIRDRRLKPDIGMRELIDRYGAVPARALRQVSEVAFKPTHRDTLTDTLVQITPALGHGGGWDLLWEHGGTGRDVAGALADRFVPLSQPETTRALEERFYREVYPRFTAAKFLGDKESALADAKQLASTIAQRSDNSGDPWPTVRILEADLVQFKVHYGLGAFAPKKVEEIPLPAQNVSGAPTADQRERFTGPFTLQPYGVVHARSVWVDTRRGLKPEEQAKTTLTWSDSLGQMQGSTWDPGDQSWRRAGNGTAVDPPDLLVWAMYRLGVRPLPKLKNTSEIEDNPSDSLSYSYINKGMKIDPVVVAQIKALPALDDAGAPVSVPETYAVSAGLAIVKPGGKLLVVHPTNARWQGTYSIPKGLAEPGDASWFERALTETREEVGLDLSGLADERTPQHVVDLHDKDGKLVKKVVYWVVQVPEDFAPDVIPKGQLQQSEVDWAGFLGREEACKRLVAYQQPIVAVVSAEPVAAQTFTVEDWRVIVELNQGDYDVMMPTEPRVVAAFQRAAAAGVVAPAALTPGGWQLTKKGRQANRKGEPAPLAGLRSDAPVDEDAYNDALDRQLIARGYSPEAVKQLGIRWESQIVDGHAERLSVDEMARRIDQVKFGAWPLRWPSEPARVDGKLLVYCLTYDEWLAHLRRSYGEDEELDIPGRRKQWVKLVCEALERGDDVPPAVRAEYERRAPEQAEARQRELGGPLPAGWSWVETAAGPALPMRTVQGVGTYQIDRREEFSAKGDKPTKYEVVLTKPGGSLVFIGRGGSEILNAAHPFKTRDEAIDAANEHARQREKEAATAVQVAGNRPKAWSDLTPPADYPPAWAAKWKGLPMPTWARPSTTEEPGSRAINDAVEFVSFQVGSPVGEWIPFEVHHNGGLRRFELLLSGVSRLGKPRLRYPGHYKFRDERKPSWVYWRQKKDGTWTQETFTDREPDALFWGRPVGEIPTGDGTSGTSERDAAEPKAAAPPTQADILRTTAWINHAFAELNVEGTAYSNETIALRVRGVRGDVHIHWSLTGGVLTLRGSAYLAGVSESSSATLDASTVLETVRAFLVTLHGKLVELGMALPESPPEPTPPAPVARPAPADVSSLLRVEIDRQKTFAGRSNIPWEEATTRFRKWPDGTDRSGKIWSIGGLLVIPQGVGDLVIDDDGKPWQVNHVLLIDDEHGRPALASEIPWLTGPTVTPWQSTHGSGTYEVRPPTGFRSMTLRGLYPMRKYLIEVDPSTLTGESARKYAAYLRNKGYVEVQKQLPVGDWKILLTYQTYVQMEAAQDSWKTHAKKDAYELLNTFDKEFGDDSPVGVFQTTKDGRIKFALPGVNSMRREWEPSMPIAQRWYPAPDTTVEEAQAFLGRVKARIAHLDETKRKDVESKPRDRQAEWKRDYDITHRGWSEERARLLSDKESLDRWLLGKEAEAAAERPAPAAVYLAPDKQAALDRLTVLVARGRAAGMKDADLPAMPPSAYRTAEDLREMADGLEEELRQVEAQVRVLAKNAFPTAFQRVDVFKYLPGALVSVVTRDGVSLQLRVHVDWTDSIIKHPPNGSPTNPNYVADVRMGGPETYQSALFEAVQKLHTDDAARDAAGASVIEAAQLAMMFPGGRTEIDAALSERAWHPSKTGKEILAQEGYVVVGWTRVFGGALDSKEVTQTLLGEDADFRYALFNHKTIASLLHSEPWHTPAMLGVSGVIGVTVEQVLDKAVVDRRWSDYPHFSMRWFQAKNRIDAQRAEAKEAAERAKARETAAIAGGWSKYTHVPALPGLSADDARRTAIHHDFAAGQSPRVVVTVGAERWVLVASAAGVAVPYALRAPGTAWPGAKPPDWDPTQAPNARQPEAAATADRFLSPFLDGVGPEIETATGEGKKRVDWLSTIADLLADDATGIPVSIHPSVALPGLRAPAAWIVGTDGHRLHAVAAPTVPSGFLDVPRPVAAQGGPVWSAGVQAGLTPFYAWNWNDARLASLFPSWAPLLPGPDDHPRGREQTSGTLSLATIKAWAAMTVTPKTGDTVKAIRPHVIADNEPFDLVLSKRPTFKHDRLGQPVAVLDRHGLHVTWWVFGRLPDAASYTKPIDYYWKGPSLPAPEWDGKPDEPIGLNPVYLQAMAKLFMLTPGPVKFRQGATPVSPLLFWQEDDRGVVRQLHLLMPIKLS